MASANPRPSHKNLSKSSNLVELIKTVVWAMVIALGVRTLAYEPFNIPSGSMMPTLLIGDYLFVSKFSYGYSRFSLPFSLPVIGKKRILFSKPKRGDIIVFRLPSDTSIDYIKRLVGLPGDKIQIKNGILHINNEKVKRQKVNDTIIGTNPGSFQKTLYIESLPNGKEHYILEQSDTLYSDNTSVYTVPDGHYFMMGDNRDRSKDSRFSGVGFIPQENLIGRAEFLFFSIDGSFWKFWDWFNSIRGKRLFSAIE